MGIDIVVMEDCASNYGVFKVSGSKGALYDVTLNGSEGPAHCTCKAFQFSGKERSCRHIRKVLSEACLYNPQWHDAKEKPAIRPTSYTYMAFTSNKCECGGPMVAVRRAV